MKRIVVALTLVGLMLGNTPSLQAQDWRYSPVGYPTQQQDHPILKKVLIGGALIGLGYVIGRATAPKPGPVYTQPPIQYGPQPGHGHPWRGSGYQQQHHYRGPVPLQTRLY